MGFSLEHDHEDEAAFAGQVHKETELLRRAFKSDIFSNEGFEVGFEIEFHLLDNKQKPKRMSLEILNQIKKSFIVPEAYSSMIEFNSKHFPLAGSSILDIHQHLISIWRYCTRVCRKNKASLVAIGSLPTFSREDMDEEYTTPLTRYQVMGERLKKLYPYPLKTLMSRMGSCCAFHIHLRIPAKKAADYYNAANIATAPVLSVSGNGPYFLQHKMWQESRIYLFESSSGHIGDKNGHAFFGENYLHTDFCELFEENLKIPALLNVIKPDTEEPFWHLMLHNGTIWRWNRPVISLHNQGPLHVRIEHRSLPSGPTAIDMLANAFFWIGLTKAIGDDIEAYTCHSTFRQIRHNFYNAAQYGLEKPFIWPRMGEILPQELILNHLLPLAYQGLQSLDVTETLIKNYLDVIRERTLNKQTGSYWQQNFMMNHPGAWAEMVKVYTVEQQKDKPVSTWAK